MPPTAVGSVTRKMTSQRVAHHRAADWPEGPVPKQIHLELAVSDLLAMEARFLGAVELAAMDQFLTFDMSPLAVVSARLPAREMGRQAARLTHESRRPRESRSRQIGQRAARAQHPAPAPRHRRLLSASSRPPSSANTVARGKKLNSDAEAQV